MPRPQDISANPVPLDANEKQLHGASQDPYFSVDVVEPLVYDPLLSTLNRMVQPISANQFISANITGGSISGSFSLSADASGNRVSAFQTDAGNLRVSSIGGSFSSSPLSADSSSVSAKQSDATNLRVSGFSNDAGLFHVSAIGGTSAPLSADSSSVSAKQGTNPWIVSGSVSSVVTNTVGVNTASANAVSASQYGTWSVSAQVTNTVTVSTGLSESSNFIGNVSATLKGSSYVSATIDNGSVSAKQGTYPWSVSGNISAFLNEGSVSAKSGDANQLHVSAVQGDAGLLRVSSLGGTFSLSADAAGNRVSTIQGDAGLEHVSAYWAQRLDAANDTVSAVQGDAGLLRVSSLGGTFSLSADAVGNRVSALSPDAGTFLVSAKQGTYPWSVSGNISAFLNEGSVSAKSSDANQLHVSSVQGDAALLRVSAIGGTAGDNTLVDGTTQTISATLQRVSGSVSSGANALVTYPQNRDDAANLRVSAKGTISAFINEGTVSATLRAGTANIGYVSATVDNGSVSAKSNDADQLRTSSISKDAGLMRVSAVGSTAGDNTLVDGTDQTVSAKLINVSASVSSNMNTLLTRITSYDAANARISAVQAGSWTLSAFLNEGSVSGKSPDAGQFHVSAFSGDAGQLLVSARLTDKYLSATVDNGSISAKQGTYPWSVSGNVSTAINEGTNFIGNVSATIKNYPLVVSGTVSTFINQGTISAIQPDANILHTSAVQGDAGLLHVSAIGGTAGDNVLVDGTTQSISATVQRVSGSVSSGANALVTYPQNRDDAANVRVSARGTVSAFINEGTISATLRAGTANIGYVSATIDNGSLSAKSSDAGTFHVSSYSGDAGQFLVSARLTDKYVSATLDNGSVSAKSGDANQFHVSSVQGDAGLLRVSSLGGSFSLSADAAGNRVSTIQGDAGLMHVSSYWSQRLDAANDTVSAVQGDASFLRVSSLGGSFSLSADAAGNRVSALSPDAGTFLVSAKQATYPWSISGNVSAFINQGTVSAYSPDAAFFRVSSIGGSLSLSADASGNRVSAVQMDAGNLHTSAFIDSGSVSAKQGTYPWSVSGNISAALNEGTNFLGQVSATIKNYPLVVSGTVSAFLNQGTVSAIQPDAGILRVSALGVTLATSQSVSAVQQDSGLLHVSAGLFPDATGGLAIFRSLSLSASQNVKSTGGSVYGYYAWNTDTKFNYIKLTNTSGAIAVGTDVPFLTIPIPPSAAANMEYPHGLITNAIGNVGIGIYATSAVADNATTAAAASAIGINLFYK